MRAVCIASILACVITSTVLSQQTTPQTKSIDALDLSQIDVIGKLSVPLGTVVDIEATIITGESTRLKAYQSQYLLSVTKVRGKALEKPRVIEFVPAPGNAAKLANNPFDLHLLKKGARAGRLTDADTTELEDGYVGQPLQLFVYELGAFKGMPRSVPEGMQIQTWQDTGFTFSTYLRVLSRRE